MCPDCAHQQHSANALWSQTLEQAESILLTPGETFLFFSWEKDPADTLRWQRLPIRDTELAKRLAAYKAVKRVLQFAGRIGDVLPNSHYLSASAAVVGAGGAKRSAKLLFELAGMVGNAPSCTPLDAGAVTVAEQRDGGRTARQSIRSACEALRQISEDPLGVALLSFRRYPTSWKVIDHAARRAGYPAHLRQVLARHNARRQRWSARAVLHRLRPATAALAQRAFANVDSERPVHCLAQALQSVLIAANDRTRQAEWDRRLLVYDAHRVAMTMLSSHFEGRCADAWTAAYREYRNEQWCADLEELGGSDCAAAILAEARVQKRSD
jgi:hypothetical protein